MSALLFFGMFPAISISGRLTQIRPRLVNIEMEYLTGYRGKHKDGPTTGGFISLAFNGVLEYPRIIVPVSTVPTLP